MTIREVLHQEIEATKIEFHTLLNSIPVNTYKLPSDNPAWTVAEVLYHMSIAPRFLGKDVKMIMRQNWLYRLIPIIFPKRLFDRLNKELTRFGARNATPHFLAQQYDRAHAAALKALAEVGDEDFEKCFYYPTWDPLLSGEVSLERLFHYVKVHFDSHAEQLRRIASKLD
ncbi:MAG: hypothetical protein EHM21_07155 [Chloroflexi bacterium]|nr:MAG: hypothetical protein EHM21_07155 [Chloroflexota bacterium]